MSPTGGPQEREIKRIISLSHPYDPSTKALAIPADVAGEMTAWRLYGWAGP